jgi:hypothetical protein
MLIEIGESSERNTDWQGVGVKLFYLHYCNNHSVRKVSLGKCVRVATTKCVTVIGSCGNTSRRHKTSLLSHTLPSLSSHSLTPNSEPRAHVPITGWIKTKHDTVGDKGSVEVTRQEVVVGGSGWR